MENDAPKRLIKLSVESKAVRKFDIESQYQFSGRRGWLNDLNGLVYYKKVSLLGQRWKAHPDWLASCGNALQSEMESIWRR